MSSIRTVVALERGVSSTTVEDALPTADGIEVLEWVEGDSPDEQGMRQSGADLVIVACSPTSGKAGPLVEAAHNSQPERPVVVFQLGTGESNGFMHAMFAAGADDIIALPETPERVRHALQKAMARKRGATLAKGATPARLICVLGPKGGTGKTVTACNLAVALAEKGRRVGLVDLDLHFGDVGLGLRLTPERTIYDLVRGGGTLDAEKLEDYLSSHVSGVRALLAPIRPDHAGAISTAFISEVLAVLRSTSDVVVTDTSAGFGPEVIAAIDSSTDVCVVGMLDAFSLKDTKLGQALHDHRTVLFLPLGGEPVALEPSPRSIAAKPCCISFSNCTKPTLTADFLGLITISTGDESSWRCLRTAARTRRLIRLRSTAPPKARPMACGARAGIRGAMGEGLDSSSKHL